MEAAGIDGIEGRVEVNDKRTVSGEDELGTRGKGSASEAFVLNFWCLLC